MTNTGLPIILKNLTMLVCPQCQYDNPNHSQSCQQCGCSLFHKVCSECGSLVSFEEENCLNCGAFTATVWWAVITTTQPDGPLEGPKLEESTLSPVIPDSTDNPLLDSPSESTLNSIEQQYLDPGQRYRLIPEAETDSNLSLSPVVLDQRLQVQGRVVDCQPLQQSAFKALLEQQEEGVNDENSGDAKPESQASLGHQMGIPQQAFSYFKLRKFCPLIPEIHDAWDDGTQEVILLSERSNWQLLSELLTSFELPTLQIVYWLNEMACLWTPLAEVHCCQSLLIENNLRVDEDQTFGLVRLYNDPADCPPTLQDLGRMWQQLLHSSKFQEIEVLEPLLKKVISGEINTITQLCLQLQHLAEQQQVSPKPVIEVESYTQASNSEDADTIMLPLDFYQDEDHLDTGPEDQTMIEGNFGEESSTADLPMQLFSLTDAGCTDIGRLRKHNEDFFGLETLIKKQQNNRAQQIQARGLYIVCDGMGGHAAGEVASAMAVDTLQRYFATHWLGELPNANTIEQGILLANDTIYQVNQDQDNYGCARMGTTLVMLLLEGHKIAIAHVGDSRIYQINRKWGLEQLTVDHEVGQRAIAEGIDPQVAYSRPDAYQLTQALGPHDNQFVKPDIKYLELHEDSLLLLCSDGLSDNEFLETHYSSCLTPLISSGANLDEGLRKLIALANQKNGHDNITAILVRIKLQPYF